MTYSAERKMGWLKSTGTEDEDFAVAKTRPNDVKENSNGGSKMRDGAGTGINGGVAC